jgi:hypothetical protein
MEVNDFPDQPMLVRSIPHVEDEDESPYVNTDEIYEEAQDMGPALDDDLDSEVDDHY